MTDRVDRLEDRLSNLERKNRNFRIVLTILLVLFVSSVLVGWSRAQTSSQVLRVRTLIIEDADGRGRIMLGSPVLDRNQAGNPRTGVVIHDASGIERFGLGLTNNGRVVMGFDAPVGKGDDRNRERITVVADENGGGYIRFLDRRTQVPARLYLDDDNRVWLEFIDSRPEEVVRRRIGFSGEQILRERR